MIVSGSAGGFGVEPQCHVAVQPQYHVILHPVPAGHKTKDVQQVIKEQLQELEHKRGLKILLAVESGSRAWGFPSPDSDYDVRIIYQRPIDWYLSIENRKDTIEYFHGDLLDINGWDIRKTLGLLRKSNATPFEWAQSPVIYQEEAGFRDLLLDLARLYFQPVHTLNHYQGIARKSYRSVQENGKIKLKKLFYVIRPLLAAQWILEKETVPPMAIMPLLDVAYPAVIREHILDLIGIKSTAAEDYVHPVSPLIREWVENRNEARYQNNLEHGKDYDSKNMMHTFRLLDMAIEILRDGVINVKRPNREELLAIRSGAWQYEELITMVEQKMEQVEDAWKNSTLPEEPDQEKIEALLVRLREELYNE